MKDEERGELKEKEEDSDEKNHSLSREGWIMLLSDEINKEEMKLSTYWNACLVVILAYMSGVVVVLISQSGAALDELNFLNFPGVFIPIFLVLIVIVWIIYNRGSRLLTQERLKPLINTREAIISGKLTDFSEIHRKWVEYIKRYYGKLLEKLEMDEEEKHEEGKEVLENDFNEQKEVQQAMQRDISDLKRRMDEIDFSNLFYVFGSLFVGGGLTMMAVTIAPTVVGPVLFIAGVVIMTIGALYKWRNWK